MEDFEARNGEEQTILAAFIAGKAVDFSQFKNYQSMIESAKRALGQ